MASRCPLPRLGPKLKRLRLAAGLSQRELARRLKTVHSHVQHVEQGDDLPSVALLMRLAKIFGVTPNDLLL